LGLIEKSLHFYVTCSWTVTWVDFPQKSSKGAARRNRNQNEQEMANGG
jgi:hypothetical protein